MKRQILLAGDNKVSIRSTRDMLESERSYPGHAWCGCSHMPGLAGRCSETSYAGLLKEIPALQGPGMDQNQHDGERDLNAMDARNVLFVDDDPALCDVMKDILGEEGYDIAIARTCEEALMLTSELRPAVALIDIKLPDRSGMALISDLRQMHPELVSIIMTGYPDVDSAVGAFQEGVYRYLQKPVRIDDLLDLLAHMFEMIRLRNEKNNAEARLKRIEWLLTKGAGAVSVHDLPEKVCGPECRNLAKLNTSHGLLEAIGKEMLEDIVFDYLALLDTSAAIYEKNGDYAAGIFSSGWCRLLDQASRRLCGTDDDREALGSGKWHCHESCWTEASKAAIEKGEPVDIECRGGIRLFAVPIRAGDEIIGAINFGYGDPPGELDKLEVISKRYQLGLDELRKQADLYESRPAYIIDLAKSRLIACARLMAEIYTRRQTEKALQESEKFNSSLLNNSPNPVLVINEDTSILYVNPALERITGFDSAELIGRQAPYPWWMEEKWRENTRDLYKAMNNGLAQCEKMFKNKNRERFWVETTSTAIRDDSGFKRYLATWVDITGRKEAEKQIRNLTQGLIKAQENERQRISRDLHDHVAQDLSSAKIVCETLLDNEPPVSERVRSRLLQLSGIIQGCVNAVRDMAQDLRPPGLDQLGMIQTISQFCEDFSEKHGINVDFRSAGLDGRRFDSDTEINLYRLVQEGLNNVCKHAQASHVIVRLISSFPYIILRIEDNGKGFDLEKWRNGTEKKRHMGLHGMKERVALLQGRMGIDSRPDQGTKIFIEVTGGNMANG